MTWRDSITPYNNARNIKPDSRFDQTRFPHAHRLTRGKIYTLDLSKGTSVTVKKRHAFHFLTNPWSLSLGYRVDSDYMDMTDPDGWKVVEAMGDPGLLPPDLLSVSFQCLLDRTYEVWDGSLPEGVLHDIAQLEKVLGVPDDQLNISRNGSIQSPLPSLGSSMDIFPGIIIKRPLRVLFGGRHAYSFDGYVTDLSIELMKFNTKMVPTRAGVSLSMSSWGDVDPSGGGVTFGSGAHTTPQNASAPGESFGLNPFTGNPIGSGGGKKTPSGGGSGGGGGGGGTDFIQ